MTVLLWKYVSLRLGNNTVVINPSRSLIKSKSSLFYIFFYFFRFLSGRFACICNVCVLKEHYWQQKLMREQKKFISKALGLHKYRVSCREVHDVTDCRPINDEQYVGSHWRGLFWKDNILNCNHFLIVVFILWFVCYLHYNNHRDRYNYNYRHSNQPIATNELSSSSSVNILLVTINSVPRAFALKASATSLGTRLRYIVIIITITLLLLSSTLLASS